MSSEKENSKTKIKAFKYLEVTLVVAVVIVVWIVMLLPVVIYFLVSS